MISSEVIHNFLINDEKVSNQLYFGISYSANIDQAMKVIKEEAEKHPHFIDNRTEEEIAREAPKVMVRVTEWMESAIQLRATVWTLGPAQGFELKCDLLKTVKERFDREGIEIPFPHRKLSLKKKHMTNSLKTG